MDFDDTPAEAAFRAEARAWLDAHAIPKGHPDDFSAGMWTTAYSEDTYVKRCREWQGVLAGGGWAGITMSTTPSRAKAPSHRSSRPAPTSILGRFRFQTSARPADDSACTQAAASPAITIGSSAP